MDTGQFTADQLDEFIQDKLPQKQINVGQYNDNYDAAKAYLETLTPDQRRWYKNPDKTLEENKQERKKIKNALETIVRGKFVSYAGQDLTPRVK